MSPGPASVPSVVNMDVDVDMNSDEATPIHPPPTPPPLPQLEQDQKIHDLVRGLQEEQQALLEQQQLLRQQAAATAQTAEETVAANNDPKAQQRLLLQQHLQLKIQQQQIQQQLEQLQPKHQQSPSSPSAGKPSIRAVLKPTKSASKLLQQQANSSSDNNNCFRPPPPNYSEASKLLQQHPSGAPQQARPRVSIKSQLVDDVLDILIRSGELPPSAANDPVTPTTPRDPPLPPPLPSHLPSKHQHQPQHQPQQQSPQQQSPQHQSPQHQSPQHQSPQQSQQQQQPVTDIKFPYIDINDLGLDLDSLGDAMELGTYDVGVNPPLPQTSNVTPSNDDVSEMEMDVVDWLDTLIPSMGVNQSLPSSSSSSASSSTSGFSSGSDPQQCLLLHQPVSSPFPPQQPQHHQLNSGDPLFSSLSSDPYTDLFSLEDSDFKLSTSLGNSLSWDRFDFTAWSVRIDQDHQPCHLFPCCQLFLSLSLFLLEVNTR